MPERWRWDGELVVFTGPGFSLPFARATHFGYLFWIHFLDPGAALCRVLKALSFDNPSYGLANRVPRGAGVVFFWGHHHVCLGSQNGNRSTKMATACHWQNGGGGGKGVRQVLSHRHTAHFVPTPPAILRKIPPIELINIPNALIQSSQNKCINPFTPQHLVTLLIHNAFSIHYGYTWMFSLLKILDRHRTTTNRHDRLPTSPRLLSFDIVCAD